MKKNRIKYLNLLSLSLFFLFFSSCERIKETKLTINFTHSINNSNLVCGTGCTNGGECLPDHSCCIGGKLLPYTNESGQNYNVQRLQYLISDIILHKDNGDSKILKDIHFIDLEDPSTLSFNAGVLENANYTSISFTMGLNPEKNISNLYVNEDFHTTMIWPEMMDGGYHYMKLEGDYDTITQGYATHTGGTMGGDYSFNNNKNISLSVNDELGNISIDINMEINNWYKNPHTIMIEPAIMGNQAKQLELQDNGNTDVFSVSVIEN